MIRVFIKNDEIYSKPLEYILSLLSQNKSIPLTFTNVRSDSQLVFDHSDSSSVPVNRWFFENLLKNKIYPYQNYFTNDHYILFPDIKEIDYLSTAFYMINAFQEYRDETENFDRYGRYRFDRTYQNQYNCIDQNIVQKCFDEFCKTIPVLSTFSVPDKKTRIFISHDIDTVWGSFLQDGLWALKRGRIDILLRLIMNEILSKQDWKNMDKIVKLLSELDLKSTFFWLATQKVSSDNVKNADYSIKKFRNIMNVTKSNGLHKSSAAFSFREELNALPFETTLSRYHFIKFKLPSAWEELENSPIRFDASLGYAERFGFRNSYGLPFRPFNMATRKPFSFIEVPLNIMDGTLHRYMKIPREKTASTIIDFIEKNKVNCILTILWHNTYFTNYKYSGYLEEFKKILLYLNESGIKSITPEEIINEFYYG